jgi:hypothetical protein
MRCVNIAPFFNQNSATALENPLSYEAAIKPIDLRQRFDGSLNRPCMVDPQIVKHGT